MNEFFKKLGLPESMTAHQGSIDRMRQNYRPMNYDIRNQGETSVIDIDGYIGRDLFMEWMTGEKSQNTVESLKEKLRDIKSSRILVNINSPGGSFNDGIVIMDLLQSKKAEVVTNLYGLSASAATVIWQGGNTRRISKNAFPLIHRVMNGLMGNFNATSLLSMAEELEVLDNRLIQIYTERGAADIAKIEELMDSGEGYGKFISADTAVELGLADEVFDPADKDDPDSDHLNSYTENYALLDSIMLQEAIKNMQQSAEKNQEKPEETAFNKAYKQIIKNKGKL